MTARAKKSLESTAAGAPASRKAGSAESAGGTVAAVAAVPKPERRNDEAQQQLELGMSGEGGDAFAPRSFGPIRWVP